MNRRKYLIPGARVVCLPDRLLVQFPSRTDVKLSLDGGEAQPYAETGPVWLRVDDGTGGTPEVEDLPKKPDEFGPVLTELVFLGEAKAWVEGKVLVVEAGGDPKLLEGEKVLRATAGDLAGASELTWVFRDINDPHQPV
jgi:hypothetical protein